MKDGYRIVWILLILLIVMLPACTSESAVDTGTDISTADTGASYTANEADLGNRYILSDIADLSLLKEIDSAKATVVDSHADSRHFTVSREDVAALANSIASYGVTSYLSTNEDEPENTAEAVYYEFYKGDEQTYRLGIVDTGEKCYVTLAPNLLKGERFDHPAIRFYMDETNIPAGIVPFADQAA